MMSFEKAREYLTRLGMDDRIFQFEVSSATVELAATALGCAPQRIAKTLSFKLNDRCLLVVAAGDAKVDNVKYKNKFGAKAKMLSPEEVPTLVGYAVGGVCPFGVNESVEVYLDVSLKRFDCIYPACGSGSSAVRLTPAELERCSGCKEWVDVCKGWQDEAALLSPLVQ